VRRLPIYKRLFVKTVQVNVKYSIVVCVHLGLVFTDSYIEQLNVASLSRPTVFLQNYSLSLLLLYIGKIH